MAGAAGSRSTGRGSTSLPRREPQRPHQLGVEELNVRRDVADGGLPLRRGARPPAAGHAALGVAVAPDLDKRVERADLRVPEEHGRAVLRRRHLMRQPARHAA